MRRARRTQRLISLLASESGSSPIAIPPSTVQADPEDVGRTIREWLAVTLDQQRSWHSLKEAFNSWREHVEGQGVLVMQLRLGKEGLRGFSLEDEHAPLVAVSTAENLQARIFTLFHEIAHLSSNTGTACLEGVVPALFDGSSLERWCDRVASAVLIPRAALEEEFQVAAGGSDATVDVAQHLAETFSVSLRALAVALIQAGLASGELYAAIEERFPASDYSKGFGRGTGQRAPQQRLIEVGPRAASVILGAVADSRLSEREARQYLRLDGTELSELALALRGAA